MKRQVRFFIAIIASSCATFVVASARAEITYSEVAGDLSTNVVKMTVTPAAAPTPVFAYRFVPEDIELKSGNAATFYYRALLDLPRRMEAARKKYDDEEELDKWYSTGLGALPVEKLPLDKMRDAVEISIDGWIWDQLNEATLRRECDFELGLSEVRGMDLIYMSLEEFQRSRELCRMLALRTRLKIAEKQYDEAIATMRANYRLADNFGSLPFIVSGLIGIAEAGVTNGTALELIAQPGSPNLYWAFSELPEPLIDMRSAARFELDFGPRIFPVIHHAATTDRSPDEWNRLYTQVFRDLVKSGSEMQLFGDGPIIAGGGAINGDVDAGLAATASALLGYSHAKAQLIARGMEAERVQNMAVGQVLAIYTERNYQQFADEWESMWYMPFWETRKRESKLVNRVVEAKMIGGGEEREVIPIVSLLLPAMQAARNAQVRLEREVAALRVIEALRMYAASHEGRLPGSLDEVNEVPVPQNPATGKAFLYRLENATGVLELPASDGLIGGNRRFEIQIAKQ